MQNYKDTNGGVHALSETDIANGGESLLPVGYVEITQAQADALNAPTAVQLWATYQSKAQEQLNANDKVAWRCVKANVAYPAAWLANDVALRAILHVSSGDPTQPLPVQPAFPVGT
jgi:hypothetical protein